jgi:hypothetical protein
MVWAYRHTHGGAAGFGGGRVWARRRWAGVGWAACYCQGREEADGCGGRIWTSGMGAATAAAQKGDGTETGKDGSERRLTADGCGGRIWTPGMGVATAAARKGDGPETGKDGSEMWRRSTSPKVTYSSGPAVRVRRSGGAACESEFGGGGGMEGMRACERRCPRVRGFGFFS